MGTLYYISQYFTTTLSVVGGINDSVTTGIVLQDVSGINNTAKPGIALINYSDPLNESICEWVTFTSINSTTKTLAGVTRGAEKGSAKSHDNGVTVAFPISESHINNINDILAEITGSDLAVGKTATQTLTNKTLTSPTVNTPTLTLADATTLTTDGGIKFDRTNEKLLVGDGTNTQSVKMGAWAAYTPTTTNVTLGAGTLVAKYCQVGKLVSFYISLTFAGDTSLGGAPDFTLPVNAAAVPVQQLANCLCYDAAGGNAYNIGVGNIHSGTQKVYPYAVNAGGTYAYYTAVTSTIPMTWTTSDVLVINGTYEAA